MTTGTQRASYGLALVLAATALAGASGYAIQLLAAALLPDAEAYLTFSVFWSMTFLFGAAIGGVQHEIARAAHPVADARPAGSARLFTIICLGTVLVGSAGVMLLVGPPALGAATPSLFAPFLVGAVGYLVVSVLTGILYGLGRVSTVALLISVDAVLRGVAVVGCLLAGLPPEAVAWAISLPFGLSVAIVWLIVRRRIVHAYFLDVGTSQLLRNAVRTVAAAAATGLMVTGLPLLFRMSLTDATVTTVASITLAVTITRAPLIIPLMAIQSFLVVRFRGSRGVNRSSLLAVFALVTAVGAAASVAAYFLGPPVVSWISGGRYSVDGWTSAAIVCSAALVALMCVTGPVLLASSRHTAYAAGWLVAALLTVALLFWLPLPALARAMVALLIPPAAGIVTHLAFMRLRRAESAPVS